MGLELGRPDANELARLVQVSRNYDFGRTRWFDDDWKKLGTKPQAEVHTKLVSSFQVQWRSSDIDFNSLVGPWDIKHVCGRHKKHLNVLQIDVKWIYRVWLTI